MTVKALLYNYLVHVSTCTINCSYDQYTPIYIGIKYTELIEECSCVYQREHLNNVQAILFLIHQHWNG